MNRSPRLQLLIFVLALGAATALFWPTRGTPDVDIWLAWMRNGLELGLTEGYRANAADYPPGTFLLLTIAGHASLTFTVGLHTGLKAAVWIALVLSSLLAWRLHRSAGAATATVAAFATSAIGLVYVDVFMLPPLFAAVAAAHAASFAFVILLVGASLIKWQPVLLIPFAAVFWWHQSRVQGRRRWVRATTAAAAGSAGLVLLVWYVFGNEVLGALARGSSHPNLSNYAANVPWVITWVSHPRAPTLFSPGTPVLVLALKAASLALFMLALLRYVTSRETTVDAWLRYSLLGYIAYFTLWTGAHENHLFVASVLALALAWRDRRYSGAAVVVAIAANLNLVAFYGFAGTETRPVLAGIDLSGPLAVMICLGLLAAVFELRKRPKSSVSRNATDRSIAT